MKLLFSFLFFISVSAFGQNCTIPASNQVFQQKYSSMASQVNDQNKLNVGIASVSQNCFTSNQIKLMALLFQSEPFRLDFCKSAYPSVFDKDNFYEVYDAFQTFSHALKLYDYVQNYSSTTPPVEVVTTITLTFPNYNYPNHVGYQGVTGCTNPVNEDFFMQLAQVIAAYPNDDERLGACSLFFKENCLTTAQAMKISSLFGSEISAKQFMQNTFQYWFDQENYTFIAQCFKTIGYQEEMKNFCYAYLHPVPKCTVSEEEFKKMLTRIDNASFASDQLALLRLLNKDWCFSTAQVKRIIAEFSFPENKLDAAEILYEKCTDRANYSQLSGSFSFPSYEEDFRKLISGN